MDRKRLSDRVIEFIIRSRPLEFADLNVDEIARRFRVSVPHLSRIFRNEQGICLHEFIMKEKITRTRFLLKQNKNLKIKDIAKALDFCCTDYFIRVFKKYVGLTPGKYRKLDGTFYGLKDRRKGPVDRRSGTPDRRQSTNPKNHFFSGKNDRRTGSKDRRTGLPDRRHLIPL